MDNEKRCFGRAPFLMDPAYKDYLWGGQRLNTDFNKKIDSDPLAETWECSTHKDGSSRVRGGAFAGMTLTEVLKEHPDFLGEHGGRNAAADGGLPILIKFIDARLDLSVQVHPSDEYAMEHENGQLGKSEMWYVLEAEPGARLVYGLSANCTKEMIRDAVNRGRLEKYLQYVPIKKGDVFFINSGTIHAIGAGALVAEIQESSNLTYRIYDYDRTDKFGNKRELHLEKAMEVADLGIAPEPRQNIRVLKYMPGVATELLSRCKYFEVSRMLVNTGRGQQVFYSADELSFRVLLCIGGSGRLEYGAYMDIKKGDCVFVPSGSPKIRLLGKMELLDVRC